MKRGQSSLEYLLTFSFALLILGSVMATLTTNQPDLVVPSQCSVSGPFNCLEHAKDDSRLLVLLRPTTDRDITTENASLTYQDQVSSGYCDLSNENTGAGPATSISVGTRHQFNVNCSVSTLGNVSGPFLDQRENMEVDFKYKEDELTFWKTAKIDIII